MTDFKARLPPKDDLCAQWLGFGRLCSGKELSILATVAFAPERRGTPSLKSAGSLAFPSRCILEPTRVALYSYYAVPQGEDLLSKVGPDCSQSPSFPVAAVILLVLYEAPRRAGRSVVALVAQSSPPLWRRNSSFSSCSLQAPGRAAAAAGPVRRWQQPRQRRGQL